jgi:hypothetical protein
MSLSPESSVLQPASLKRTLRFRDLILYGIILIQPTAPMPSFGVISAEAHGHVVTAILLAMAAWLESILMAAPHSYMSASRYTPVSDI